MTLPGFSIVIETSNLRLTRVGRLRDALASIAAQVPSPAEAAEVVLLEDGSLPAALLADLARQHPWLTIRRIAHGLG